MSGILNVLAARPSSGGANGSKFGTDLAGNSAPANTGSFAGGANYTFVDKRNTIGSGVTVYKLYCYLTSAVTGSSSNSVYSLIMLFNSSNNYTATLKTANWTHTGTGWEGYTLPTPWTHPGTGTYYVATQCVGATVDACTGGIGDLWNASLTQGSTYSGSSPWYAAYGNIVAAGYQT